MDREPIPPAPALDPSPLSFARPRLDAAQRLALSAAWRALWRSRALVWTAGLGGLLVLGRSARWRGFDPGGVTMPFGWLGDALVAPAARWDSVWYLAIAHDGYREPARTAFFPLYPLAVRAAGSVVGSPLIGGLIVSLAALLVALYLLHRLVALELDSDVAGLAVALVAVFPAAYCFSAVYSESLFLALSVGAFYSARLDRWAWAGALSAFAAASRSAGVVLVVPLALIYLYGPRGAGPPPAAPASGLLPRHRLRAGVRRLRPRHRLRFDALWLAGAPLGLAAFLGYLAVTGADPLAPFHAQATWMREFAGPFGGVWDGTVAAFDGARQLLSGSRTPVYFTPAGDDPFVVGAQNLVLFASLLLAIAGTAGALRRLPVAYGGYMVAALALPLSYPVPPQPLMSLPRFLAVLFPLHMWLALWARERGWERRVVIVSGLLLALATAQFTAWEWVA